MFRSARRLLRDAVARFLFPHGFYHFRRWDVSSLGAEPALVAMCLWNRPERFREILEQFAEQDLPGGVVLGLWNNNWQLKDYYEDVINEWRTTRQDGALGQILLAHSPANLGGVGRFYVARRLARRFRQQYVMFLDDDQQIGPEFARVMLDQASPGHASSWWAWTVHNDDYWTRTRALPGDRVDYAGTGGMVIDAQILSSPDLFRSLPKEHWFLEDIWLNHIALSHGFSLGSVAVHIDFVMDETNQFHALADQKPVFYRSLAERRRR